MVVNEEVLGLFLAKLFERVGPENVAHQTVCWRLPETVNLITMSA
jgi:hypothetical protein